MGMTNLIRPGWLSRAYRIRWKPAKLPLPQNLLSRTEVFLSTPFTSSRITTPWGEPSSLWTFESILLDQGFPVEHKLDAFNPPLTGTLFMLPLTFALSTATRNFAQTFSYFFSGDLHTSLLQQTGSHIMAGYFIPDLPSNSWTFGSTLLDPGFHRWIRIRRINSASGNLATLFLDNIK